MNAPAAAASPTFISQYGPLIAALIALVGVILTLLVNARRDARKFAVQREDEYRKEQRVAMADLIPSVVGFQRSGVHLGAPSKWVNSGYEHATDLRNETDRRMEEARTKLIVCRLLFTDAALADALDKLYVDFNRASQKLNEVVDHFWAEKPALHDRGCSWGLKPPVSSSDLAM